MNPTTDTSVLVKLSNGHIVQAITPNGRLAAASKHWRLTEKAFQRYAAMIEEAITNWEVGLKNGTPVETSFKVPDGMSANTFEHRFRDAVQALTKFGYDKPLQARLLAIKTDICVGLDATGEHLLFRARKRLGRPLGTRGISSSGGHKMILQNFTNIEENPTETSLRIHLATLRTKPIRFSGKLDDALQQRLEAEFDTAFAYDSINNITTML